MYDKEIFGKIQPGEKTSAVEAVLIDGASDYKVAAQHNSIAAKPFLELLDSPYVAIFHCQCYLQRVVSHNLYSLTFYDSWDYGSNTMSNRLFVLEHPECFDSEILQFLEYLLP